jgi:hypothetical protein
MQENDTYLADRTHAKGMDNVTHIPTYKKEE